ncbi:MAG: S8 family peptidase [Candidatus Methanodesulfokora sp.]
MRLKREFLCLLGISLILISAFNVRGGYATYKVILIDGSTVYVSNETGILQVTGIGPEVKHAIWRDSSGLYVVPRDVNISRFDIQLFNIERLIKEGYYNMSVIPVIIMFNSFDQELFLEEAFKKERIGRIITKYAIIPGIAALIYMNSTERAFKELTKIDGKTWLDRKVYAYLNVSVPLIGAPSIWNLGYNGSGIKIAILDTGIDNNHPDFKFPNGTSKIKVNVNFSNDGTSNDLNGHGTHCASIAAGTGAASNGKFTGVAPGALLWNVKVLNRNGEGYSSWVISGIQYAALGPDNKSGTGDEADILSLSFGAFENTDGTDPLSLAVDNAVKAGAVVVVAAGNEGPGYHTVGTPACSKMAVTVGASDKSDFLAEFSSWGPTYDLRVKPDVLAPGVSIIAARASNGSTQPIPENKYYAKLSGTSMAAPHVAGVVALMKQAHPSWNASMIKNALIGMAKDLGHNIYKQGGGRVNAQASVLTKLIPLNASISLGLINGTKEFNITFLNVEDKSINISFKPLLYDIMWRSFDNAVHLNSSMISIPPNGSRSISVFINSTGLPQNYYSGIIWTNYSIGGSYLHSIFGFSLVKEPIVLITGSYVRSGKIELNLTVIAPNILNKTEYAVDNTSSIEEERCYLGLKAEDMTLNIDGKKYDDGIHTIYVRGVDSMGEKGPWVKAYFSTRTLYARYNLISLIFNRKNYRASDLSVALPSITLISRWDPIKQDYFSYIPGFSGLEDDFRIELGSGYFIYLSSPGKLVEVSEP